MTKHPIALLLAALALPLAAHAAPAAVDGVSLGAPLKSAPKAAYTCAARSGAPDTSVCVNTSPKAIFKAVPKKISLTFEGGVCTAIVLAYRRADAPEVRYGLTTRFGAARGTIEVSKGHYETAWKDGDATVTLADDREDETTSLVSLKRAAP